MSASDSRPEPALADDTRRLFWLVDVGVFLYLALDIMAQVLPPHYDPISTAESDLAVGPYGFILTLNFVNRGVLSLAFLYAFARVLRDLGVQTSRYRRGVNLLGVWAVGAFLLALFPTDVPSTPVSWHGLIHLAVALFAFLGGALGILDLSLHLGATPALSRLKKFSLPIAVVACLSLLLLFGLPIVAPHLGSRIGGVTERFLIGSILLWILTVSLYLGRRTFRVSPSLK